MTFADFVEELKFHFVAFHMGARSHSDIINWAGRVLERNDSQSKNSNLILLYGLGKSEQSEVASSLDNLIQEFAPGFKLKSPEAAWFGHQVLREHCQRYLNGDLTPDELCIVAPEAERLFDFPAWLGDLWNVCDRDDNNPRVRREPDIFADECRRILNFDSSRW